MVAKNIGGNSDANGLTDDQSSGRAPESGVERSQLDKFKEAARQLETDDDEDRFEKRLKKLVKQKPGEKADDD